MTSISVMMPVLIEHEWQIPMTRCAIDTLRATTEYPFELVVVETGRQAFNNSALVNRYVHKPERTKPTLDCNAGLEAATGDLVVYTGNDIFTRPGWLEALLSCFARADCGIATLASADLKATNAGVYFGQDIITEGLYGPFCMFPRTWRYDAENFPCQFADSDLIMRIYEAGGRMLRNNKVIIEHLNRQTLSGADNDADFQAAKQRFIELHQQSGLLVFRALAEGWIV